MALRKTPLDRFARTLIGVLLGATAGCSDDGLERKPRIIGAEIVEIRLPERLGALERPAVEFDHRKHTKELEQQGCKACHPEVKPGELSLKIGRLEDGDDRDALVDTYHTKCMGCHAKRAQEGERTGPLVCGECHVRRREATSTRRVMAFTYPLHDLHVKVTEKDCATCHNFYDKQQKKFIYKKGVEGGSGDFHGAESAAERLALRTIAHATCVKCHRQRKDKAQKAGPIECRGCHEGKLYKVDVKLTKVENLLSNQPDKAWIRAADAKSKLVPFDHRAHEPQARFCSTCHHKTLKACRDCHTLTGTAEGEGVTVATAYHDSSSTHSCVGCHQQTAVAGDCAGCHARVNRVLRERTCTICHSGPQLRGKDPATMPASMPASMSAAAFAKIELDALPAASDDFPEEAEIKTLVAEYGASKMPHRKIVARLDAAVRKSKMASRFHGQRDVLCAGCHHRSPVGGRPAPCKACHGSTAHATKDQPALKTAYHRQCLGCHQTMGLKQGCTDCHEKATKGVGR